MQYSQEIQEKAAATIAKGCKLPFEKVCEILNKAEINSAKKRNSAKSAAKWDQRQMVANTVASANPSEWLAAKNRENAMKNLPSSMR